MEEQHNINIESLESIQLERIDSFGLDVQPIQSVHDEQMRQAKWTFNFGIAFAIVGLGLLLGGVLSLWWGVRIEKVYVSSLGTVLNIVSAFMFKFHKLSSARLDEIRRDENAFRMVTQINDPGKRDDAICALVKALYSRKS